MLNCEEMRYEATVEALEDKIVQQAVVTVLTPIYEANFLGFSYGFRPGRNQHQALDAVVVGMQTKRVNWVLDADIKAFFDTVDYAWMMRFLEHRIGDTRVLRLIRKWLTAGVVEDGKKTDVLVGTPQAAVISPLLANIYLHYVFDLWTNQWRGRHAKGDVMIVRYADDSVLGFESKSDVDRFLEDLKVRFAQFGLTLNEDKTRVLQFGRFAAQARVKQGLSKPPTFDFLGFTHESDPANAAVETVPMRPDIDSCKSLEEGLLRLCQQAVQEWRLDVAEHLLLALEQLAKSDPACEAALEQAYLFAARGGLDA